MRTLSLLFVFLVGLASLTGFGRAADRVDDLKARVEKSNGDERIKICTQIAELQLANADKLYTAGNAADARSSVEEVATYRGHGLAF